MTKAPTLPPPPLLSPPLPIRISRTRPRDAPVSQEVDENVHWKEMREPALSKNPEIEPALLFPATTRSLQPLSAMPEASRSALAPRTDANHTRREGDTLRNTKMPDALRSMGETTPPRPPSGDTSISDLVKPSWSFEQQPNFIARNPKDSTSPTRRCLGRDSQATAPPREIVSAADKSIHSQRSARSTHSGPPPSQPPPTVWSWVEPTEPESQEQTLFEQRLCEDVYGVAVRKINQNGKSTLRYVKCIPVDDVSCDASDHKSTTKSVSSLVRTLSRRQVLDRQRDRSTERGEPGAVEEESQRNLIPLAVNSNRKKALVWGKKKDVKLTIDKFVCVRKGKTTDRTRRNAQPSSRLLSLITDDANHPSLDIEAPTKLDRDKFAHAFSRFLGVPLLEGDDDASIVSREHASSASLIDQSPNRSNISSKTGKSAPLSAAHSAPDMEAAANRNLRARRSVVTSKAHSTPSSDDHLEISFEGLPVMSEKEKPVKAKAVSNTTSLMMMASQSAAILTKTDDLEAKNSSIPTESLKFPESGETSKQAGEKGDEGSVVSSLTGAGFDQEIVEELHQALTDLRAELEASRAEAARAVKVAEQAIQSAENSSSKDWNSTVTHKAAEAAALAQKKSAEAMAKQRIAEERLTGERKNAAFWRKQAEAAEEEAGVLQTRAAAAEVQRAAMAEELDSERRKATLMVKTVKQRYSLSESHQSEALEGALERNRSLLIELDGTRKDLELKRQEAKVLHETLEEAQIPIAEGKYSDKRRMGLNRIGRKKRPSASETGDLSSKMLLASETAPLNYYGVADGAADDVTVGDRDFVDQIQRLQSEADVVRRHYELLRRATADELRSLPESSQMWANQVSQALSANQAELSHLRKKLAVESATRRRLLHEVQDLRGVVRVYCRPRPFGEASASSPKSVSGAAVSKAILSVSSQETLLLHRDRLPSCQDTSPMSFEFDGIFQSDSHQKAVYSEMEELVLGVLDGYNVCIMAYGQTGSGKTHSLLGDVRFVLNDDDNEFDDVNVEINNEGIQLQSVKQLFTVSEHRNERYQDEFSFTIVEVHDERLVDLVAGTDMGELQGRVDFDDNASRRSVKNRKRIVSEDESSSFFQPSNSSASKGNKTKLEIRTNHDGNTVVQGLVSIPVNSYEDVLKIWREALIQQAARVAENDVELSDHEASTHVIATLKVVSTNIVTGIGCVGKINFVDLAGADLTTKRPPIGAKTKPAPPDPVLAGVGNNNEWKYVNKSLATLCEVVNARCQFNRSVPYRNSTLTHLLRDSLEADTKVLLLVCVSSDPKDVQETASALRFASKMRRVNIGKATKHTLGNSPAS